MRRAALVFVLSGLLLACGGEPEPVGPPVGIALARFERTLEAGVSRPAIAIAIELPAGYAAVRDEDPAPTHTFVGEVAGADRAPQFTIRRPTSFVLPRRGTITEGSDARGRWTTSVDPRGASTITEVEYLREGEGGPVVCTGTLDWRGSDGWAGWILERCASLELSAAP